MSTNGAGLVRNAEARRGAARPNDRHAEPAHVGDQVGVARRDPGVRGRQQGEQAAGSSSKRSRDTHATRRSSAARPLRQQGRLAVTGGRGDADHAAIARASRPDEPGTAHGTWPRVRDRQLGLEQRLIELDDRPPLRPRVVFRHRGLLACRCGDRSARRRRTKRGAPRASRPRPTRVSGPCSSVSARRAFSAPGDPCESFRYAARGARAPGRARDRYGMAAVRIYLPILIERDRRRRLQIRPSEQVNGRGSGRRTAESLFERRSAAPLLLLE